METKEYTFAYKRYGALEQMPPEDRELLRSAQRACATSYSPYSGFRVGAALRLESGEVLCSSNQESEVLPSGICAERGLLYYVQANRRGERITALALASEPGQKECTPCGACRQVIADTQQRQGAPIRIIMGGTDCATVVDRAELLLPFMFKL